MEEFILDDYLSIDDSLNSLPIHKALIVTNHRASRDPYTVFSKELFKNFNTSKLKKYIDSYKNTSVNSLFRFGRYIEFWNRVFKEDYSIEDWISSNKVFSMNREEDLRIAKEYVNALFSKEEKKILESWNWRMNYIKLTHHPSLEQQLIPGTTPAAEGSQRDPIIFLLQVASSIDKYSKSNEFIREFKDDYRREFMSNVLENAKGIGSNFKERLRSIREYFKSIGVVDRRFNPEENDYTQEDSRVFSVVSFPPTSFGRGEVMIQGISRYPFIYQDIGLKQVPYKEHAFSMDDNGWWLKLGNANLDPSLIIEFNGSVDKMLILANKEDWNLLNEDDSRILKALSSMLKDTSRFNKKLRIEDVMSGRYSMGYSDYHMWNEALNSPIALNLLLDNLVDIFQKEYDSSFKDSIKYQKAMDWGSYWDSFISTEPQIHSQYSP